MWVFGGALLGVLSGVSIVYVAVKGLMGFGGIWGVYFGFLCVFGGVLMLVENSVRGTIR